MRSAIGRGLFLVAVVAATLVAGLAPAGPKREAVVIAVLDLEGGNSRLEPSQLRSIADWVRDAARSVPRAKVITRENIIDLLAAADRTLEECSEAGCATEYGRVLQADYVVTGLVSRFGKSYSLTLKLHDTGRAEFLGARRVVARTQDELPAQAEAAASRLFALLGAVGAPSAPPAGVGGGTVKRGAKIDRGEDIVNRITDETGFLTISTKPEGATLFLNGKQIGTAPKVLDQMVGKYVVVAELGKLYHPARQELDLTSEGVTLSLTLPPAFGSLRVTSKPSGAEVWLDGERVGVTPFTADRKPSGSFELRVVKDHYLSFKETIAIKDGESTKRDVVLQQNYGGLEVQSNPAGAAITLDGTPTGDTTPHSYPTLEPGVHTVKLTMDGYGDAVKQTTVRNRATERVSLSLQAKYGLLSIMSTYDDGKPCFAKVFLDGQEVGSSPMKKKVLATEHEVRVVCGLLQKTERIQIEHNKKKTLHWTFPTEEARRAEEARRVEEAKKADDARRQTRGSDDLRGLWVGEAYQPSIRKRYPVEMMFLGDMLVGNLAGRVRYPSFDCDGTLTRLPDKNNSFVFLEKITHGECVGRGTIVLENRRGKLHFRWYYPNGKAGSGGTLTRK